MNVTYPEVTRIVMLRCSDLNPNLMFYAQDGELAAVNAAGTEIEIEGVATLDVESSVENCGRTQKAKLKFASTHPIDENGPYAFVVESGGRQYLVGTREAHFPVVEFSQTTGRRGGEASMRTYTVTHIAPKTPLECVH